MVTTILKCTKCGQSDYTDLMEAIVRTRTKIVDGLVVEEIEVEEKVGIGTVCNICGEDDEEVDFIEIQI